MNLDPTLGSLLLFLSISGVWAGLMRENCTNYGHQFEKVFSVPGDVAMMDITWLTPDVLNFSYNTTWYNSKTEQEMTNQTGQILVLQESLWFLNTTLDDAGEYVIILRTPAMCYMQSMWLIVHQPLAGECGRPIKSSQVLMYGVSESLKCPLGDYVNKLKSYKNTFLIKWYKDCNQIKDAENMYMSSDKTKLMINGVKSQYSGTYTCTLTFTLGGVTGSVSESIEATVKDKYALPPEVKEPFNETIKAKIGSKFNRSCLVFVPSVGKVSVGVVWLVRNTSVNSTHPSARIYSLEKGENKNIRHQDKREGVLLERQLIITELRAEDFNTIYTCRVDSTRGVFMGHFTLLPAESNLVLPISLVFGSVTVLLIISTVCYIFRMDTVLWFRRVFPILSEHKDGKLYDAYVAYPQPEAFGFSEEVEEFALHTLPQVLEETCGYKLFVPGRDCLPGQAVMDSVDENIQDSHRVLLLYTASTFTGSTTNNNSNIFRSDNASNKTESKTVETRQQLEYVAAMHRALLEGSVKVVLVELEQIPSAHLDLFPESVLHLRKKQGAVCWWKNFPTRQRWRTCMRWREDEEKRGTDSTLSLSLSPSSRFWKEIRYHMPVRGRRVVHPENSALLNL